MKMQSLKVLATVALATVALVGGRSASAQDQPAGSGGAPAGGGVQEEVVGSPAPAPDANVNSAAVQTGSKEVQEEIVVTGSRLRRKDLTGPAPVAIFTQEDIVASGRTNIGDFLQTLTEQSNALNRGTNNGGDGSIRINLRGLGVQRTLVLLNGRRLSAGGVGADASVDLSAIPTNVIERVEILMDGASAVYGSDAIGGVVNIITKKRYNGADINLYGSTTTHDDGQSVNLDTVAGVTSEKGGFVISGTYFNGWPAWANNRPFSALPEVYNLPGNTNGLPVGTQTSGSGTIPNGRIVVGTAGAGNPNGNAAWNNLVINNPAATSFAKSASGAWVPYAGNAISPNGGWNYQPYNYLVTPQTRYNLFTAGEYFLGSNARLYYDAFYTKRTSAQQLAPEPLLTLDYGVTISPQNIYNPFGTSFSDVRRRLVEAPDRGTTQDINNFHLATGIDGTLPDSMGFLRGWVWDFNFNFSRDDGDQVNTGALNTNNVGNALGPSYISSTGQPTCGTPGNPVPTIGNISCVPLNLFGGPGTITKDQLAYVTYTGGSWGYNQLIGGTFNTSGDLFRIAAERPVGLALGYEYRNVSGGFIQDPIGAAGQSSDYNSAPTQGQYNVNEVYAELAIPIVDKLPGLEALELIAAARESVYDTFGSTFNYKFGARWSPVKDFTVRGTYSTAFRAPNISELYSGQTPNFPPGSDPCAGPGIQPNSPLGKACGSAINNGDSSTQLQNTLSGNAALQPETAKIFTVGIVIAPRWVKGLSLTADYYNTLITNTIESDGLGEATILSGCYPTAAGQAPQYCQYVQRDPTSHFITNINSPAVNVGQNAMDGFDFAGDYIFSTSIGRFAFDLSGTYLDKFDVTLANGQVIHGAGTFDLNSLGTGGASGTYPHWRFNAGAAWGYKGFGIAIKNHFIGSFIECGDDTGQLNGGGLCYQPHIGQRTISPNDTTDLNLSYGFKNAAGRTEIALGFINIFDQYPPAIYNGFSDTTDTYAYDVLGRQFYARLSHHF